ncbi:ImmA/IrrE family metallo-endopeptidase [Kribbella sp. NBC_01245]|uniref:ImmA/IrrE family metallo-endopeptidase n=1 Tax=Kribbella sp. NBC_01245 TaxID=2903578 RepID=UPI002E2E475A|nr:ImmA/IrrE family metallo-endopeptidase [Kribbella sp. NBC_01245]
MNYTKPIETRSVLAALRSVIPARTVSLSEAKRIAELQASKFLALFEITEGSVPSEIVSELPRVQVIYEALPVSGTSHWNGTHWIIALNNRESSRRQRFTLMHEFKHILDHGRTHLLYTGDHLHTASEQAELVANYFAGCVLLPKRFLKSAWGHGIQSPFKLAYHFDISPLAVTVRLAQTGLSTIHDRCVRPATDPTCQGRPLYQRSLPTEGIWP